MMSRKRAGTIVVFTTDNGAEVMSWPDGGSTPFRGEKATNWEGGYRVPMLMRWPGVIQPGTISNDFIASYDLLPTFAAAGGNPDIVVQCLKGSQIGNKTFKVHLDGYNLIPFLKGEVKESPRNDFLYWNDDGELVAVRVRDWKIVFKEQDNKNLRECPLMTQSGHQPACTAAIHCHSCRCEIVLGCSRSRNKSDEATCVHRASQRRRGLAACCARATVGQNCAYDPKRISGTRLDEIAERNYP